MSGLAFLFDDFVVRALLAALGTALAASVLGCFVVWRKMAYFGDALSHSAILGVALALLGELPLTIGVLAVAVTVALAVTLVARRGLAIDTVLGVFAHGFLAFGLIVMALDGDIRSDPMAFLLGDVLAVSVRDLAVIWAAAAAVIVFLVCRWTPLILSTLNRDLAAARGHDPDREELFLALALAALIAVAIKVVGAILITPLIIIPAAVARMVTGSPVAMAVVAALVGWLAAASGIAASLTFDSPAGPSVIAAAFTLFALTAAGRALRRV